MIEDGLRIDEHGTKRWFKDGLLHRLDGPAIIYPEGNIAWYKDGLYHRLDGPAVVWKSGTKFWYQDGLLHRLDGPAVELIDESQEWWYEGKLLVITSEVISELLEEVLVDDKRKINCMVV